MLNLKSLTDKLDTLTEHISQLNERLDKKDEYIATLEASLSKTIEGVVKEIRSDVDLTGQ